MGERLRGGAVVCAQGTCLGLSRSGADEAGVEGRACEGDVGGALDDGAAVGEEGEVWSAAPEAEEELVGAEVVRCRVCEERLWRAWLGEVEGRWCSWIWTELRPQRVMCGRPAPARCGEVAGRRRSQAGSGGRRWRFRRARGRERATGCQRSKESRVRRMR